MDAGIGEAAILATMLSSAGAEAGVGAGVAAAGAGAVGAGAAGGGFSLGTAAAGASYAGTALSAFSSIFKGKGTQAADEMQADRLKRAAEFGRLQADLTDTTMREQLNTTLGNIDVIRAAGKIDPTSPTTAVLEDRQRQIGQRDRDAAELNIRGQNAEDEAGADFLRKSGNFALLQGYLGAGAGLANAGAKGLAGIK